MRRQRPWVPHISILRCGVVAIIARGGLDGRTTRGSTLSSMGHPVRCILPTYAAIYCCDSSVHCECGAGSTDSRCREAGGGDCGERAAGYWRAFGVGGHCGGWQGGVHAGVRDGADCAADARDAGDGISDWIDLEAVHFDRGAAAAGAGEAVDRRSSGEVFSCADTGEGCEAEEPDDDDVRVSRTSRRRTIRFPRGTSRAIRRTR